MLNDYAEFERFVRARAREVLATLEDRQTALRRAVGSWDGTSGRPILATEMWCPACGGPRTMFLLALALPPNFPTGEEAPETLDGPTATGPVAFHSIVPSMYAVTCTQKCGSRWTFVVFQGPKGPDLVALPAQTGRGGTPHTPEAVAFYLDQAARARSAGAYSAGAAMYRAAVEQMLFDQGYTDRMLGPKIQAMERDRREETGPSWVREIQEGVLTLLKRLGDGAIHPNGGDISRQQAIDTEVLGWVDDLIGGLLDQIYEVEAQRSEAQSRLAAAVERLNT